MHSSEGYAFLFNLPSTGKVEYNSTVSAWRADAVMQMDIWVATTATEAASPWQQLQVCPPVLHRTLAGRRTQPTELCCSNRTPAGPAAERVRGRDGPRAGPPPPRASRPEPLVRV